MRRPATLAAVLATIGLLSSAGLARAHPLGNFTDNHYAGVRVSSSSISLDVVVDLAEIPTFQERLDLDTDGDGEVSDEEAAAARIPRCDALTPSLHLVVNGALVQLRLVAAGLSFPHGAGGLPTLRQVCEYVAPFDAASDPAPSVSFRDTADVGKLGWREVTVAGDGVAIEPAAGAAIADRSLSSRLTAYPPDRLKTPLDVREAAFTVRPGGAALAPFVAPDATSVVPPDDGGASGPSPPAASASPTSVPTPRPAAVPGGAGGDVPAILRAADLTPAVVVLSLLAAIALGAGHALTPGHGKTIIAAYLVGTRGRRVDALWLGLAVSVSHTLGILGLAALVVGAEQALPPDSIVRAAPVAAGATTVLVGVWMLASAVRGSGDRRHEAGVRGGHPDDVLPHPPPSPRSLFALGLAGGIVPSTNALLILLVSIAAGRAAFGFVLVGAFGLGMAAVMAAIGVAAVQTRGLLDHPALQGRSAALSAIVGRRAPLAASVVVLGLGLWLTGLAVAGSVTL